MSLFSISVKQSFSYSMSFAESNVTSQMLHDSFKHYLSHSEASIVDACLNNSVQCDDNELLEFLSAKNYRKQSDRYNHRGCS